MGNTKENWKVGKNSCYITSDIKPIRPTYDQRIWELEKEYYGGYLIAESIPDEKKAKLIAAAPELLEALMNIENDGNTIPDTIWEMRCDAIKKATE